MNRIIVFPPEESLPEISMASPYSKANELAAWKKIGRSADEALSRYPTTLADDLQIL